MYNSGDNRNSKIQNSSIDRYIGIKVVASNSLDNLSAYLKFNFLPPNFHVLSFVFWNKKNEEK